MKLHYLHFDEVDSTQNLAKRNLKSFSPNELTFLTATHQTHGRGRGKNTWRSVKNKSFLGTFVFYWERKPLPNLGQILALSLTYLLEAFGFIPKIKWPNDLMLSGKKVGGTLVEIQDNWIMAGLGLNILLNEEDLKGLSATSLFLESKEFPPNYDITTFKKILGETFLSLLYAYKEKGFFSLKSMIDSRLSPTFGEKISFSSRNTTYSGIFKSLEDDGSISLLLPSNKIINIQ